jgi:AraC family transcriptional regulator
MQTAQPVIPPLSATELAAFAAFIDARLGHRISIDAMGSSLGMSGSCFSRRFRVTTGETPHAHLVRRRVEAAAALIEQARGLPLAEIASRCGFADQAHLTRVFRKRFGTTPAAYCRRSRGSGKLQD